MAGMKQNKEIVNIIQNSCNEIYKKYKYFLIKHLK